MPSLTLQPTSAESEESLAHGKRPSVVKLAAPMRAFAMLVAIFALAAAISAQGWCGFIDAEQAQVRCGYSTLAD
jgi:hypothetical protein